jgi:hypothetical protein
MSWSRRDEKSIKRLEFYLQGKSQLVHGCYQMAFTVYNAILLALLTEEMPADKVRTRLY